jgi:hypothetical protein
MNHIRDFIRSLPPYTVSPYVPFHIIIYSDFDIYSIKKYMIKNWKKFININTMQMVRPVEFYSVCQTTSTVIIEDIINVLFETIRVFFEDTREKEEYMKEENLVDYLTIYLEMNLNLLVYKKTKNIV